MSEQVIENGLSPGKEAAQQTPQDRLKEITEGIERGIQELFSSDKYAQYLKTMSRFHHYSLNNTILIFLQKPDATLVTGFGKWRDKFQRHVKKGEKSIKIIAPTPFTIKKEQEKRDPETNMLVVDEKGDPVMEEVYIQIPRFKVVPVFDVSQTDGKPLPQLVHDLHGHVEHFDAFFEAVMRSSPVPMDIEPLDRNTHGDGYYHLKENRIVLREGMSEVQTISAAIHEITHATLHNEAALKVWQDHYDGVLKDTATQEVEAESVSYAVCQYYGIETKENSFGYIANWSKTKELAELKASLETINQAASSIISEIDRNLDEIMQERGLQPVTQEISGEPAPIPEAAAPSAPVGLRIETSTSLVPSGLLTPDCGVIITMKELQEYGYTANELLPLTQEKAYTLFEQDVPVYALYPDGTESMMMDHAEITAHTGYFGVDREDWKQSRDYQSLLAKHDEGAEVAEQFFINQKSEPAIMIYQLRDQENRSNLQFLSMEELRKTGQTVERGNYEPIYTITTPPDTRNQGALLDAVFQQFNLNRPDDFRGHSLSVSDIVALKVNGQVSFHYVDSTGFQRLPDFLGPDNPQKNAEMAMEDDYGMIDGIINNGKNPALEMNKKEPCSIMEQLKKPLPASRKSPEHPLPGKKKEGLVR